MLDKQLTIKSAIESKRNAVQDDEVSRGSQGRELTLQATAYTWTGDKTSTGTWPRQGVTIAVNPKVIPFYSKVFIEGVGWRTAEDRIPKKSIEKGASIDIYMDSESDCWAWGRRSLRVKVIPPENVKGENN